jgi:hypothetical protein
MLLTMKIHQKTSFPDFMNKKQECILRNICDIKLDHLASFLI